MASQKYMETQKWLILAHCFNMDGRAASQTITDRLPFLMAKGIIPVVLSAPTGTKDRQFPHYRVLSLAPSGIIFELRHLLKSTPANRFLQKILKGLVTLILLPFLLCEKIMLNLDSQWSWFLGATIRGYFLVKKYRPSLVYSTAGPPSTHVTGYFLSMVTNLPWLAEIHDPLLYDHEPPKGQRYKFKNWIEKSVCENASAVIYFTEKALENANRRHPIKGKSHVLRPGANPPDITSVKYKKRTHIHFGHFGSLAEDRNLSQVFVAFQKIFEENPRWRNYVYLDVFGTELDAISQQSLFDSNLHDIVRLHGRLERNQTTKKTGRQQVIEAMRQTDVLLLIHGEGAVCEEYIPSKLYEYLLVKRPILGIVKKDTELEEILKIQGHSTVDGNDSRGLIESVQNLIKKWETEGLDDMPDNQTYTIENTVVQLLAISESITMPSFDNQKIA